MHPARGVGISYIQERSENIPRLQPQTTVRRLIPFFCVVTRSSVPAYARIQSPFASSIIVIR